MSEPPHDYPDGWCHQHEELHAPMDWTGDCERVGDAEFDRQHQRFQQAWQQAERSERDLRLWRWRAGRFKRFTVCWWKHRTRRLDVDVYVSSSCWACARPDP